jgi:hypothetical protein
MDKMRADFEAWANKKFGSTDFTKGRSGGYVNDRLHLRWEVWQAARATSPAPAVVQITDAQPKLTVWYGSMPESNGKSNYTAILNRADAKGLDAFCGFTIARSEYPDRVRYEADCVRHLIGELPEKPCITDYDADKHSGYVAPAALAKQVPAQEQAWISVTDNLPGNYISDDSPCKLDGREIPPAIQSKRVLVALSDGSVREDRMEGLQGNTPFWSAFRDRVTHWMPLPPAPAQLAQSADKAEE